MAIVTGNWPKALWPGVNTWYGASYNEFSTEYTEIFETVTSKKAWEEEISGSYFGLALQKPEGSPVTYDGATQGFIDRYTHVVWALGFIITREMVEDDQYDVIGKKKASALAMSIRQTKEINAINVLNRAFTAAFTFGDGKTLVAADHPNVAGGTWSNKISVAADISEAALEQMYIDIGKYTNDRGLRIKVLPKKLIVAVDNDFEVNKILQTEYEVGTPNNTKNIIRSRIPGGVFVSHYLTHGLGVWFVITDVKDGLKYFERRGDEFNMDEDFDSENAKYKATSRYSVGATDKKAIYGSAGA